MQVEKSDNEQTDIHDYDTNSTAKKMKLIQKFFIVHNITSESTLNNLVLRINVVIVFLPLKNC